ncbi:NAD-dependent epimerase/dehydratase family protein [Novosphingobium sp. KACC 22771]|uniref:NAD-dependent epimerase/dehydratase family protein n=1 Tax=Novosphingobium sp. KACC 22771 TaxID=3025670 RepID=UPI002366B171|nr:NAD-dependent epimerase/dehydratase family protein [Novosphingobium sp. KACC 22771]WDF71968.1 NAD-dependent epimerase/dehydratase family protein [Novosphingobium sp. KACC 22771]
MVRKDRALVALTGGTGFVGRMVLELARSRGISVHALARRAQPPQDHVSWVAGDLSTRSALDDLVRETEAVIHVAGLVNAADPQEFERANVIGTMNMIEAARAAGVPRFIFVSSLSAREPELSAYGASKARAEMLVKASGLDWTIIRPPAVYGPRDAEMFELFRAAKWGVVPVPAGGRASMIHVEDLARLLLTLIPGGMAVNGHTFEPDDGVPGGWSHIDMGRAIGAALGKRPWILPLGPGFLRLGARIDGMLRGAKAKLTPDRVGYMTHPDWVVSPEAAPPADLWRPLIETRGGLTGTAEWYRREGWL